jgi:hypothetical protein
MIDESCIGFHASEAVGSAELEEVETAGAPSPPPPQPVNSVQAVNNMLVDKIRMDWFLDSFLM